MGHETQNWTTLKEGSAPSQTACTPGSIDIADDTARTTQSDDIEMTSVMETETNAENEDDAINVVLQEDIPPNGGYGWFCMVYVFLINANTWGVNGAWAIFLARYLSDSTFPDATRFDFALIGGLSVSCCYLITPIIAIANQRIGTRGSMLLGAVLIFAALLGASYASRIWHLYLSIGLCFGFGIGFSYITATAILPQWFSTRRSLATGLASAGTGLGGLAYSLATNKALETLGIQWTYRMLAFCSLAFNLPCSILLRDRNKAVKPRQAAFDYREYARIEIILLILWGFGTELGYIVLLFSLPNYATTIGLTYQQGSIVNALLNLTLGLGRAPIGWLSDRYGRINIATLTTLACGILCFALWVPSQNFGSLLAFALLSGTCCGVFWNTITSVTVEVVGMQRLPSAFGLICLVLTLPATFAEPIALAISNASGYVPSQVLVGLAFVLASVSTWLLRCWKIYEIEIKAITERGGESESTVRRMSKRWLTTNRLVAAGKY